LTIPRFALPYLQSRERPLARLFPPVLSGIGRPAVVARLLDGAATAWPLALATGLGLVFLGLWGSWRRPGGAEECRLQKPA
jgi:hypothetical protein